MEAISTIINKKTDNIDIFRLEEEVKWRKNENEKLKAIVPVHLYGQLADMDPILELTEKYGLIVIEDACQAHGAEYLKNGKVRKAGSMALAGCFSFYPGKNLGSCSEGGAVVTNDETLAHYICRKLINISDIKKGFPVTELHAERLLSLLMFSELTKKQIEYVVAELKENSNND